MKKKKKRILKVRLPMEAVEILRSRGGSHSTKKGKKGYKRQREKEKIRREEY